MGAMMGLGAGRAEDIPAVFLKAQGPGRQPAAIQHERVIAVPTLIKELPLPSRKLVGDMSNTERILIGINLKAEV